MKKSLRNSINSVFIIRTSLQLSIFLCVLRLDVKYQIEFDEKNLVTGIYSFGLNTIKNING